MIPIANNSEAVVVLAQDAGLYQNLIDQLIKDFDLSGLSIDLDKSISTEELVLTLNKTIEHLLQHRFDSFLQLLYRIDIPENSMQNKGVESVKEIAQKASFAILKREWQKVYLKNKFS